MRLISSFLLCVLIAFPGLAAAQDNAGPPIRVRVGEHADFSRVVFDWPSKVPYRVERTERQFTVHFERPASLDLSRYRKNPPPFVNSVTPRPESGGLAVQIEIPQGSRVRHFENGTHVVIDVHAPKPGATASAGSPLLDPTSAAPSTQVAAATSAGGSMGRGTLEAQAAQPETKDKKKKDKKKKKKRKKDKNDLEFDIDAAPKTRHDLTPSLSLGARIDVESDYERNFDLDDSVDDDRITLEPGFELALRYRPNDHLEGFLDLRLAREFELLDEDGALNDTDELVFKQLNVTFRDLFKGFSAKVGRMRLKDEREWLYDEELDAATLYYTIGDFGLHASVNRQGLVDLNFLDDDEEESITNYFLFARYSPHKDHRLGTYLVVRDDLTADNDLPIFVGARAMGEAFDDLEYWFDAAAVTGRRFNSATSNRDDLRGFGVDVGATYEFDTFVKPSITLGYAFGTGDSDPTDDVDHGFLQTGLHDNQGRFNGVTNFKYYGEILDPDLSNLSIFTAGLGVKPSKKSSLDAVYHYYRLSEAVGSHDLGQEIDLVLGSNEIKGLKFTLVLGYFVSGEVFPAGSEDDALLISTEIRYRF